MNLRSTSGSPGDRTRVDPVAAFVRDGLLMAFGSALVLAVALFAFDARAMTEQTVGVVLSARDIPEYGLDRAWSWEKLRFWLFGDHRFTVHVGARQIEQGGRGLGFRVGAAVAVHLDPVV